MTLQSRRAFTLIEVLVVLSILAVLAGLVIPRLTGNAGRAAQFAADDTADLFSLFAHHESVGDDNIAIGYDPAAGVIMLLEQLGSPGDPDDPPRWDFNRTRSQVRLPADMDVVSVRRDGLTVAQRGDEWFVPVIPGEGRPNLEIDLYSSEADVVYTIYLASYEIAARVITDRTDLNVYRLPVDLDDQGRSREAW